MDSYIKIHMQHLSHIVSGIHIKIKLIHYTKQHQISSQRTHTRHYWATLGSNPHSHIYLLFPNSTLITNMQALNHIDTSYILTCNTQNPWIKHVHNHNIRIHSNHGHGSPRVIAMTGSPLGGSISRVLNSWWTPILQFNLIPPWFNNMQASKSHKTWHAKLQVVCFVKIERKASWGGCYREENGEGEGRELRGRERRERDERAREMRWEKRNERV